MYCGRLSNQTNIVIQISISYTGQIIHSTCI